jgi:hypothetical protein
VRKRVIQLCYGIIFACLLLASVTLQAAASIPAQKQSRVANITDFPTVDPNYVYNQLAYMVTTFQQREAGYRASAVGHDGFANYWAQEMARDLAGLGPQVRRDPFSLQGWLGRPADAQAFNVEVSVPGALHPEQVVVIGCHYDGMAISTQSANDDASGCAIELGVARAMGNYWRSHHIYPARTLRFVIFDAEEQGIFGSFHYLDSTINGDTRNLVAMFNEEQNGIAYPLRYLGRLTNPLLPFYIYLTPLNNTDLYPAQERLSPTQRANIVNFRALMQQAVPAVFQEFLAAGYQTLTYHGNNNQDVAQPIFTPDQVSNVTQLDDHMGGSDQIAFTLAGVPCATFAGNSTYYDNNPPAWSYPYDQRQDTIQLMNTFAQGGSHKSNALALALALPGMITAWMLNQPSILGQSAASGQSSALPIAAISDIGQTRVGQRLTLNARASFVPAGNNENFTYSWNFGDGTRADGIEVSHTYTAAGSYTLTLDVSAPGGTRRVSKILHVTQKPISYHNVYADNPGNGDPPSNPQVHLPTPDDTLQDKVSDPASATATKAAGAATSPSLALLIGVALLIGGGVILVLLSRCVQRCPHRQLR